MTLLDRFHILLYGDRVDVCREKMVTLAEAHLLPILEASSVREALREYLRWEENIILTLREIDLSFDRRLLLEALWITDWPFRTALRMILR